MTATVDPRPIAVARVGLGIAAMMTAAEGHVQLSRISEGRLAMPFIDSLPAPSPAPLMIVLVVGLVAGGAVTIGVKTAHAAAVTSACQLMYLLWDQQTYSSHRVLIMLLTFYLVFARSDRAWSLRARRTRVVDAVPYWPQLLMMGQLSALYLFAGLSKINPVFLQGHVLRTEVWWPLPTWLLVGMSIATVLTEVFLAVALWVRRARWLAAAVGVALHLSIVLMLRDPTVLVAFALACVPLYPLFLTRPVLGPAVGATSPPIPDHGQASPAFRMSSQH